MIRLLQIVVLIAIILAANLYVPANLVIGFAYGRVRAEREQRIGEESA